MPEGLGYGIGRGLQSAAEGLWKGRELQIANNQDRDRQADKLVEQMHSIRDNLVQVGPDTPQGKQLSGQLKTLIEQHNALYPPHETPALLARIQKVFGKTPAAPQADPRASMTLEGEMATAPQQKFTGESGDFIQLAKLATDPSQPQEARTAAQQRLKDLGQAPSSDFEKIGEPRLDKTTNRYYQVFISKSDPSKQKTVPLQMDFQPTGTQKAETAKTSDETIASEAKMWSDSGVIPPAKDRAVVEAYMTANNLAPKSQAKPVRAWTKQNGKIISVELDPKTNQPIPGTENPNLLPPAWLTERTITSDYFIPNLVTGDVQRIQKTSTSGPAGTGGGGGGGQGTPTPKTKEPDIVANRGSEAEKQIEKDYIKVEELSNFADAAATAKSSIEDKALIESLVKAASGRFSQASYANMVDKQGLTNRITQWYNDFLKSGQLPDNVRNQAVKAAHDLKDSVGKLRHPTSGDLRSKANNLSDPDPLNLGIK